MGMTELNMFQMSSFGGLLVLALDLWAIMSVLNSNNSLRRRVIWVVVIGLLPALGFLLWLIFGPRSAAQQI